MSTTKQISLLATLDVSFDCMMRGIGLDAAAHFATKQPRHICRLQRGKSKYSLSFLFSRRPAASKFSLQSLCLYILKYKIEFSKNLKSPADIFIFS